jgi:SEC-C motif-containing protein
MALVIVTRADSIRAKARALVAGLLAMMIITVPVIMIWAKLTSLELDDLIAHATASGAGNQSAFVYYAFHGFAFSQPVGVVGVWLALVMFGQFREGTNRQQPISASRNAPCPCASGRKYKRCCGRGE